MPRFLYSFFFLFFFTSIVFAQSQRKIGLAEQKITDSICNCVVKLDMSKITNKDEATAAYTDCILKHADLLAALASERNVELSDRKAMEAVGVDIAADLLTQNCNGFKELAILLGGGQSDSSEAKTSTVTGTLKRIETRGFNYFVIVDRTNKESSFIWLRQFPGSDEFMNGGAKHIGKRLTIQYTEMEVFLPQAKGYYKIKEIVSIKLL